MFQDIQYDPQTGEIGAVVNYSALPEKMPPHPSRLIVDRSAEFVPLYDLPGHKVDLSDPFAKYARRKTPEELAIDAAKETPPDGGK